MKTRKTKKAKKASVAKRGGKRMKLSAHVGYDFDNYMSARSFSFKKRKGNKLPSIRKVDTKDGRRYVVVLPTSVKKADQIVG